MVTFFHICLFFTLFLSSLISNSCCQLLFFSMYMYTYKIHTYIYIRFLFLDWELDAVMKPKILSLKYFSVHFLKSKTVSYLAIIYLSKLNWSDTITWSVDFIHTLPVVPRMYLQQKNILNYALGFVISLVCFNLEEFFNLPCFSWLNI